MDGYLATYPILRTEGSLSNRTPFGTLKGLPTTFIDYTRRRVDRGTYGHC